MVGLGMGHVQLLLAEKVSVAPLLALARQMVPLLYVGEKGLP